MELRTRESAEVTREGGTALQKRIGDDDIEEDLHKGITRSAGPA